MDYITFFLSAIVSSLVSIVITAFVLIAFGIITKSKLMKNSGISMLKASSILAMLFAGVCLVYIMVGGQFALL